MGSTNQPRKTYTVGELLVEDRVISKDDLDDALDYQRTTVPHVRLGECLIALGHLKREHLELVLAQQRAVRDATPLNVLDFAEQLTQSNARVVLEAERLALAAKAWGGRHA